MLSILREYLKIEKAIISVIIAEFFLQLINSSFMAILPLYMKNELYTDGEVAQYTKYRFIGVLVLAVGLGLYIKGKKIKNFFYISCFLVPTFGLFILYAVHAHIAWLNYTAQVLWGSSFLFMQVAIIPYILRNSRLENHTGAIALSYATWSLSGIVSSGIIAILSFINPYLFSERVLLHIITIMGFISIYFVARININEVVPPESKQHTRLQDFDWKLIIRSLIPTLLLAVGAGFTIPFISLFFSNVHHLSTFQFSTTNLVASILIALGAMLVPKIKKHIGYQIAIPTTQSFAIIALVLMATTQYYSELSISVYIAVGCFLLRQPLMNLAGPMTSEIVMNYSGKRNQEMVSALTSSIWSGSWFFTAIIFGELRDKGVDYVNIFLITAALYTVGVVWYYLLIVDYNKRKREGLIN